MKYFRNLKWFTIFILIVVVFCGMYLSQMLQYFRAPPNTSYQFAAGYIPDYYQYLSWIKSGKLGDFLLTTRYSGIAHPKVLVHPLFSITGQITGLLHITPPFAFLLLQIAATFLFLYMLYLFIRTLYPSRFSRSLAIYFFLFGTGFYTIAKGTGMWQIVEPIPWSGHFNIISKYSIPPHHMLALAAWLGILVIVTRFMHHKYARATILFLFWCIGLLNPSLLYFFLSFIILGTVFQTISDRTDIKRRITGLLQLAIGIAPLLIYNTYIIRNIPPWSIMYQRTLAFNPDTSFINYLFSLGPLLPLSLIGIWIIRKRFTLIHFILASWAYLPILLFPFVGSILPINYSRLFQSYQYLPIIFLSIWAIPQQANKIGRAVRSIVIPLIIGYGMVAYTLTLIPTLAPHGLSYYNVFVPKSLLAAFKRLDTVPGERVILSGEYTSHMIPAFTRHRALIGRDDSVLDYYPLQDKTFAFLDGRMTEAEALAFVQEQKINYVIFGVDTKPFKELPTQTYPFLIPIFQDGSVTVTRVDPGSP